MMIQFRSAAFLFMCAAAIILAGCKKDDNPVSTQPSIDANLVGAWYSASDTTGVEIKSDGTFHPLMVNASGNLSYDSSQTNAPTYKLATPSANNFTLTISGKSMITGRDTSMILSGTYALSNNNSTLIITTLEGAGTNVQAYVRSTLGAHVLSAPAMARSKR
ncbi:MAG TPA: hypothetical protein VK470_04210 [Bacteroidota bacterium]|nr:hypothetical protein [Bacteroidota bacterium]